MLSLPTFSEEGWVAVVIAMLSGVGLEMLRRKMPSKDAAIAAERDAETKFRDQLLRRIEELNGRVEGVENGGAERGRILEEERVTHRDIDKRLRDLEQGMAELRVLVVGPHRRRRGDEGR